jgi:SAM-dependent methyltransferase
MTTRLRLVELWPDELPNSFKNRVKETIAYLDTQTLKEPIADCGENNPMKQAIEKHLGINIHSLTWDFNYPAWYSYNSKCQKFNTILCLEVLEHLFNPLTCLLTIKDLLAPGGVIYLSTPYQRPQLLKSIHHYHEIPDDRILWLFEEAELSVVEMKKITIAGNWYNHIGIRPLMRYFQKTRLYKLQIKSRQK